MASDLLVALPQATIHKNTLFGANGYGRSDRRQQLRRIAAGVHPADEPVRTTYVRLPQVRQTYALLGCQPEDNWGFTHGVNENHVAIGVTGWHSRLPSVGGGLTGTDVARLALERSHSAMHAVDVMTDLIARHGLCPEGGIRATADNVFLVADHHEAFVLEAAGRYWAVLECQQVRAVTDIAMIHQDWQKLSSGLSQLAIDNGWWDGDGSKLDFAGCLATNAPAHSTARRRWGRATLALEQQNGAIDGHFLRRMLLGYHDAGDSSSPAHAMTHSFMTSLADPSEPLLAWCAFGPPGAAVHFPIWLDGHVPSAFYECSADGTDLWQQTQDLLAFSETTEDNRLRLIGALERLQTQFEQEVEAMLPQARFWKRQGESVHWHNQATALMERHVARFARECRQLHGLAEAEIMALVSDDEYVSYIS
jgi:hypothetical protein